MDPLTISLALGCVIKFSHIDRSMTDSDGSEPDGVFYKAVTLKDARGQDHVLERAVQTQGVSPGAQFRVGRSPDGLFASYLVFMQAAGHNIQEVRFVSAKTCGPIRFVRARDGAAVNAGSYQGWIRGSSHSARLWRDGNSFEPGLPLDEARQVNPAIPE